jgi:hypothetical protein
MTWSWEDDSRNRRDVFGRAGKSSCRRETGAATALLGGVKTASAGTGVGSDRISVKVAGARTEVECDRLSVGRVKTASAGTGVESDRILVKVAGARTGAECDRISVGRAKVTDAPTLRGITYDTFTGTTSIAFGAPANC